MERLLTSNEVRNHFKIAPTTIWRWRKSGKLLALKTPGGQLRFRESDLLRVLEEEAIPA